MLALVCFPAETREIFGIGHGTALEIFVSDAQIILQVYTPGCHFCGEVNGLAQHRGKNVCALCIEQLRAALQGDAAQVAAATGLAAP